MKLARKIRKWALIGLATTGISTCSCCIGMLVGNAASHDNKVAEIGEAKKEKQEERDMMNPFSEGDGTIKVMSYNIAHCRGAFPGVENDFLKNLTIKSEKQVYECLDTLAEMIIEEEVDIAGLQETDWNATWSFGINYAKYLAEKTGLKYYSFGTKWDALIPFVWLGKDRQIFPYFKGRIGNTVLSRYPILQAENKPFDGTDAIDWLVGEESYLDARILLNGGVVRFINTHFDSENADNREVAAKKLVQEAKKRNEPLIIVGDFNAVIPSQQRYEKDEGRRKEKTMETIINSSEFNVFMENISPFDANFYTSNSDKRERTIDFIIPTKDIEIVQYYVHPAMYSDHFAVFARLKKK